MKNHFTEMTLRYSKKEFKNAKECSVCHKYSKDFWFEDEHRTTIRPKGG